MVSGIVVQKPSKGWTGFGAYGFEVYGAYTSEGMKRVLGLWFWGLRCLYLNRDETGLGLMVCCALHIP